MCCQPRRLDCPVPSPCAEMPQSRQTNSRVGTKASPSARRMNFPQPPKSATHSSRSLVSGALPCCAASPFPPRWPKTQARWLHYSGYSGPDNNPLACSNLSRRNGRCNLRRNRHRQEWPAPFCRPWNWPWLVSSAPQQPNHPAQRPSRTPRSRAGRVRARCAEHRCPPHPGGNQPDLAGRRQAGNVRRRCVRQSQPRHRGATGPHLSRPVLPRPGLPHRRLPWRNG